MAFLPTDISGCVGWFDATQISGLNNGDAVSTWADLSGGGRDLSQSTAASKPTYRRGGSADAHIFFDGVDDYMTTDAAGLADLVSGEDVPASVFVAIKPLYLVDPQDFVVWANSGNNNTLVGVRINATPAWVAVKTDDAVTSATRSGGAVAVQWNTTAAVFEGTTVTITVNGEVRSDGLGLNVGVQTVNRFGVGARTDLGPNNFFVGDIGEVIVYNSALSAANRRIVEDYLTNKWRPSNISNSRFLRVGSGMSRSERAS